MFDFKNEVRMASINERVCAAEDSLGTLNRRLSEPVEDLIRHLGETLEVYIYRRHYAHSLEPIKDCNACCVDLELAQASKKLNSQQPHNSPIDKGNKMPIELSDVAVSRLIEQSLVSGSEKGSTPSRHVGSKVFIRTVTMYYTGELVEDNGTWLVLRDASWVADSGRWADALSTGDLNEVEPYPDGYVEISRDAVIDISAWNHDLPRKQI